LITGPAASDADNRMKSTDSEEEVEIESGPVRIARLTFLASLGFWPIFLFATSTMLGPPTATAAARLERDILVYSTWGYPVAVGLAWFLSKRGMRLGKSDVVCLLPWILPALVACYWLASFFI
jgi:hypothetical protein